MEDDNLSCLGFLRKLREASWGTRIPGSLCMMSANVLPSPPPSPLRLFIPTGSFPWPFHHTQIISILKKKLRSLDLPLDLELSNFSESSRVSFSSPCPRLLWLFSTCGCVIWTLPLFQNFHDKVTHDLCTENRGQVLVVFFLDFLAALDHSLLGHLWVLVLYGHPCSHSVHRYLPSTWQLQMLALSKIFLGQFSPLWTLSIIAVIFTANDYVPVSPKPAKYS